MTLLFIMIVATLAGGAFYIGMEYGAFRERSEREDRLSLPPPAGEKILQLPKNASGGGPYRSPDKPLSLPPPRRRGLFEDPPELGLTDLFKHARHYGTNLVIYMANNSEMVAQVDMGRATNELERYLRTRNRFQLDLDELQNLYVAIVRERNSTKDIKLVLARLQEESSSTRIHYSMRYTLVFALGEVWPPSGEVIRQLNAETRFQTEHDGRNEDAERRIRQTAEQIIHHWKQRDEVAVTIAMCE